MKAIKTNLKSHGVSNESFVMLKNLSFFEAMIIKKIIVRYSEIEYVEFKSN